MKRLLFLAMFSVTGVGYADTYYYVGPTSPQNGYHLEATFKVNGALLPNTDYMNLGIISGSISVLDNKGNNAGASTPIPVTNWISIRTNAQGLPQYWIVGSNVSTVTMVNNDLATSNGSIWQAYTNNAPKGWAGYLANVNYEQYTYFIEYPVAQGCPAATPCNSSTTAPNGLSIPTYSPFNYMLAPANATTANWSVIADTAVTPPQPVPVTLTVSSTLPNGIVGSQYTGSVTVTNGTGPYTIKVTGLPSGLFNNNGVISGSPTTAGTSNVTIDVTDSNGDVGTTSASVLITASCSGQSSIVESTNVSKLFMSLANGQKLAYSNVYGSQGTTNFTFNNVPNGSFAIGNIVTYAGVLDSSNICVPNSIIVDAPPPVVPSCASPQVLDTITNTCVNPVPPVVSVPNEGKSRIVLVNGNSFTIATGGVITTNTSTNVKWNRSNHSYQVGDRVEWKGKTVGTVFVANKITLN